MCTYVCKHVKVPDACSDFEYQLWYASEVLPKYFDKLPKLALEICGLSRGPAAYYYGGTPERALAATLTVEGLTSLA